MKGHQGGIHRPGLREAGEAGPGSADFAALGARVTAIEEAGAGGGAGPTQAEFDFLATQVGAADTRVTNLTVSVNNRFDNVNEAVNANTATSADLSTRVGALEVALVALTARVTALEP